MSQTQQVPAPPPPDVQQPLAEVLCEAPVWQPTAAIDLVRATSLKLRRYEAAFVAIARDIAIAFDRLRTENAQLRASVEELEARASRAEERARHAISCLNASNNHCMQLRHQVRDLEIALDATEEHLQKSTGYISRLGAYIMRGTGNNDDVPAQKPSHVGATTQQVEAILRRRAG